MSKNTKKHKPLLNEIQGLQESIQSVVSAHMREQEQTESVLRESEARLEAVINTVVDGIITINERGIIESFNPAAEKIFGYKAKEVIGKNISMLMPSPYHEEHDKYLKKYIKSGIAKIIGVGREARGLRKNGTTFPIDLAVSELKLDGVRIFTGIVRDITERKKAEEVITSISERERRQFGQELHDGLAQKLTGIALIAKTLQKRLADKNHAEQREAGNLAELASEALYDVKGQAHGLYPIELERHGLSIALHELSLQKKRRYHVCCHYEESVQTKQTVDTQAALQLYRIAQEAVNNAVKHGQAKNIWIKLIISNNSLTLTVENDGADMPEPVPVHGGMGLAIMRYRAGTIGAKFNIQRRTEGGTKVTCTWIMPVSK